MICSHLIVIMMEIRHFPKVNLKLGQHLFFLSCNLWKTCANDLDELSMSLCSHPNMIHTMEPEFQALLSVNPNNVLAIRDQCFVCLCGELFNKSFILLDRWQMCFFLSSKNDISKLRHTTTGTNSKVKILQLATITSDY